MKKQISSIISLFLLTFSLGFYNKISFAREIHCNGYKIAQKDLSDDHGMNSLGKTQGFIISNFLPSFSSQLLGGVKPETLEKCAIQSSAALAEEKFPGQTTLGSDCEQTEAEAKRCAAMALVAQDSKYYTQEKGTSGLLGLAARLESATKEPVPVNLAYYVNKNAQKIPFIKDTAFAATSREYGGFLIDSIYTYWQLVRNAAYLFMSIVMLIIGILIMGRNKVDAKAAITIQQVLPQIIIALVLITFSYPIGAAGASLAYNIRGNIETNTFLSELGMGSIPVASTTAGLTIAGVITLFTAGFTGVGAILVAIAAIAGLVVLAFQILVFVKTIGIYLKMLMAIITAPITFAFGALPGNQKSTTNWFLTFGANMLSLPALEIGKVIVTRITTDIGLGGFVEPKNLGSFGVAIFATLITPIIAVYGYKLVLDIPSKIDEALGVGGKKK